MGAALRQGGNQVEGQKPYEWDSDDRKTGPSYQGGRRRRVWRAEMRPCGKVAVAIRWGAGGTESKRVRGLMTARDGVVLLRRGAS